MSPYAALGLSLLAVIVTAALALWLSPRRKSAADYGRDDGQWDVQPERDAQRNWKPPLPIILSSRQVERINTQRKLRGKPPLSRKGLSNAVAHPWDRYDVRQPQSTNDWISYLIAYEIFFDDHKSPTVGGCGSLVIDPNSPYNGQGGEYAGAGASGSWGDSLTRAEATAVEHGVPLASGPYVGEGPGAAVSPGSPVDPYAAVAAEVSSSSLSSPSDSYSSSSSSDSYSSSSSSDSSSSFSGGGDSGGGGGGGGGGE